jgi:dihydroorotase
MKVLIKSVTILDKQSEHHLQKMDVLISQGQISKIARDISSEDARIITGNDLYCSVGLCDIGTHLGEPGLEHRETLYSLTRAARRGGYSALAVFSNHVQPLQNIADIEWLKSRKDNNHVDIFPMGVMTSQMKGAQMIDYMDVYKAGIGGFSDGLNSLDDTGLLVRILEYTSHLGAKIFHHPSEKALRKSGHMNEGLVSTQMGLKGMPEVAELIMAQRDIFISEYLDRELVLHAISSGRTVEAVKKAKLSQLKVKATVPYLNLLFTDENLRGFDTALKVVPVLRTEDDRISLLDGLKDHTIDAIISNHVPMEEEEKRVEFPYAAFGATGLETCLSACVDSLREVWDLAEIIDKMTVAPRHLLGVSVPTLEEGSSADLCVFDLNNNWTYDKEKIASLSKNSPFLGHEFKTRVVASIIANDVVLSDDH